MSWLDDLNALGDDAAEQAPAKTPPAKLRSFRIDAVVPSGLSIHDAESREADVVPRLAPGTSKHLVTCTDMNLPAVIRTLVERHGPVELHVATWRYAADWTDELTALHTRGDLLGLTGVIDPSSLVRSHDARQLPWADIRPRGCHSKIFLFAARDGSRITWMSSANISTVSDRMFEAHIVTEGAELYDAMKAWILEALATAGDAE